MIDLLVEIVTFNTAERNAVNQLLWEMTDPARTPPTSWALNGNSIIRQIGRDVEEVRHRALGAQGNVMAGSTLAEILVATGRTPDYIVFYGCAGTADGSLLGHAFLVESTSYVSLGTVTQAPPWQVFAQLLLGEPLNERVTLKNKWLCDTSPKKANPLHQIRLDQTQKFVDLRAATRLDAAHVAATDKVVTAPLGRIPQPNPAFGGGVYDAGEWSYGEALSFVKDGCHPVPLLIEMESYGIGRTTEALHVADQVVILRIVTDALANKDSTDQAGLLIEGLPALRALLGAVILAAGGH